MPTTAQLDELSVLQSIYGDHFSCPDPVLQSLVGMHEPAPGTHLAEEPRTCSFRLLLSPMQHALELSGMLPPTFPEDSPSVTLVSSSGLSCTVEREVQGLVDRICSESKGEPGGVFEAATAADELGAASYKPHYEQPTMPLAGGEQGQGIRRMFFWTHHTRKKQHAIADWAAELSLTGRLTVSKPGYMLIEGTILEMREFARRNMGQSWKEIKITWEETVTADEALSGCGEMKQLRLFQDGLRQVSVDDFIAELRSLNLDVALEHGTRGVVRRRA